MTASFDPSLWFPPIFGATETAECKRAIVYSPEPIGLGTGGVESLRSYLLRIADAHCVGLATLARFLEQRHSVFRDGQKIDNPIFRQTRICGAAGSAKWWSSAAELVTGRNNLRQLTLLPLRDVVPLSSAVSPRRKWCPACVSERSEYAEVHEPLLWCLQAVRACPTHNTLLVEDCGCGGQSSSPPWKRKMHPGVCPHCGRTLTSRMTGPSMTASVSAVHQAQLAADLLLLGQRGLIGPAAPAAFVAFLHNAAEQLDGGGRKAFARRLGCSAGQLKGWMDGRHKLRLQNALHAILTLGASAESAFVSGVYISGQIGTATVRTGERIKQTRQRTDVDWAKRLAALVEAQHSEPPVSVSSVGKKLGISARTLRRKWPDHCRAVAQRYTDWKRLAHKKALEERASKLREAAAQLARAGVRPSRRRILKAARSTNWNDHKKLVSAIAAEATTAWAAGKSSD